MPRCDQTLWDYNVRAPTLRAQPRRLVYGPAPSCSLSLDYAASSQCLTNGRTSCLKSDKVFTAFV